MKPRVLLLYYSFTQQTLRVADAMAESFREHGWDAQLCAIEFTDERHKIDFPFRPFWPKLLRWLIPFMLVFILMLSALLVTRHLIYEIVLGLQVLFYVLAGLGTILRKHGELPLILYVPYYFCLVNIASARGILEVYLGKTYTTWSTARTSS